MVNQISNIKEDSLLVWLDNSMRETQKQIDSTISSLAYWRSGKWEENPSNDELTETDLRDIMYDCELQITKLSFRLDWINKQIENLKK